MEYLVTGEEMKRCDEYTSGYYGIPACVLMERAALASVETLLEENFDTGKVLVVCGSGNNGGDGMAVARLLFQRGTEVSVFFVGREESCTEETRRQLEICRKYGINMISNPDFSEYTSIVDAVFGTGLSRPIEGMYKKVIDQINRSPARVLALDIPSGIHPDRGELLGTAVSAAVTVTFAFCKRGLLLYRGKEYSGKVVVKEMGITQESFGGIVPKAYTYSRKENAACLLPARKAYANKGTFGKVLLIAGSSHMAGAALLAAKASYRVGCGLVRVLTDRCNRTILQSRLPEAITDTCKEGELPANLEELLSWPDVIGMGPGIGKTGDKRELLQAVLTRAAAPLVLDADALNLIAESPGILENHRQPVIITPHVGEMARLTGQTINEVLGDLCETAKRFAAGYRVICVLKDAGTVVTDGENVYVNQSGNSGMSTGGSGDVLTGMITGLLAQGMKPMDAACLGVWLHGAAGDEAAARKGAYSMLAGDIVEALSEVMVRDRRREHEKIQ